MVRGRQYLRGKQSSTFLKRNGVREGSEEVNRGGGSKEESSINEAVGLKQGGKPDQDDAICNKSPRANNKRSWRSRIKSCAISGDKRLIRVAKLRRKAERWRGAKRLWRKFILYIQLGEKMGGVVQLRQQENGINSVQQVARNSVTIIQIQEPQHR